jgi:hypothetical protein
MPHRRSVPVSALVLLGLASLLVHSHPAAAETTHLFLTAGMHSPLGGDEREAFGLAPQVGLGVATEFADGASMLGFDLGYIRSSGAESSDDTFDLPESHYTLVPITVSITTRLADGSRNAWPKIFVGVFATVVPTRYTDPNGQSDSNPTVGAGLELRPEFRLGEQWRFLGRSRLSLFDTVDYGDSGSTYNYSALSLELGLSTELR